MLTFGNKVENGGTTPQGILTAEEFNALVKQVNANSQRADGSVSGIIINGETATPNRDGYIEIKALNDALAKLDDIEDGSQANKIEKIAVNGVVQPIEGKTALLSVPQRVSELTNDAGYVRNRDVSATLTDIQDRIAGLEGREEVSSEQLEKIDSVEAGAQVNVLESVIFNGAVLPVVNKEVSINIDLSRKADLDENGKVLASQMPSYVDDVLDAYAEYDMTESGQPVNIRLFEDEAKTKPIKPESQKIYLDKESKYQYRWTGTEYATIGAPTVIGEVAGTAYDGSKGKALSDAFSAHASNVNNPHQVTKGQVGLGNVDNTADKDKNVNSAIKDGNGNVISETYATLEALNATGGVVDGVIESVSALNKFAESATNSINQLSTNKADKSEVTSLAETVHGNTLAIETMEETASSISENLSGHIDDRSNPHQVTKSQIGLGNVDNTADKDKNVNSAIKDGNGNVITETYQTLSASQQIVAQLESGISSNLNEINSLKSDKADKADLEALSEDVSEHISDFNNPHQVTKGQVGLGNVDNTADKDKPVSSVQQAALDKKADKTALNKLSTDTTTALDKKVDKISGKTLSSNDYTTAEKNKLSGIASGAEVNTIVAVQRNGTAITPKDRVVNILVPVKTSELNNDSTYQTAADVAETIVGVKLDLASGIITLTRKNGTTFTLDLPTEKIIKSGYYDSKTKEIVLVLEDESEIRFSASELIDEYYADESTLELYTDTADGNKKKFRIKTAYKNKIDGSEQTTNKTASVSASSTETQYPTAKAVYNAVKDSATKVQTFTQASTRANIESGETIATVFGKVRKWFADLKTVAFSGSYNDLSDKPTIGNGKVTIKQKGVEKGSFAMNQSGDATIELTDENTTYGIATSTTAGLVKSGGDITVASDGVVSVNNRLRQITIPNVNLSTAVHYVKIASVNLTTSQGNSAQAIISGTGGAGYIMKDIAVVLISARNDSSTEYIRLLKINENSSAWSLGCGYVKGASVIDFFITISRYNGYKSRLIPLAEDDRGNASESATFLNALTATTTKPSGWVDGSVGCVFSDFNWNYLNGKISDIYRKLSGVLELTDSNLATYFNSSTGVLTIPNGVTTILFNTSSTKKVFNIVGGCAVNGYRLTIAGQWLPVQKTLSSTTGCFSSYIYGYRAGALGTSFDGATNRLTEAFEDFIYFNGVWYSKAY